MLSRRLALILCLPILMTSGCAAYSSVPKQFKHRRTSLVVNLPSGWLRFRSGTTAYIMTKNGLQLETIEISLRKIGKKLSGTERVFQGSMLPLEIAELSLGLIEASDATKNFKIEEIKLAHIGGQDGYEAVAHYYDTSGLKKRLLIYGMRIDDYICEFTFSAAQEVYYQKYLDVFTKLIDSVTINTS